MNHSVVVIGSTNTDMVIKTDHMPAPGETILGGKFFMNPGGKGANQAVAAVRLGGTVTFITKVGSDIFGNEAVQLFNEEGIDTGYVFADPDQPSGVALITVDRKGENAIVVASGANATLSSHDLQTAYAVLKKAAIVLLQLEIPVATVMHAIQVANQNNKTIILNPAPACTLPNSLLRQVSIITPNETEAELLTGIRVHSMETAERAATALVEKGVATVIITLGSKGALVLHESIVTHVPSIQVDAVDTTAAGDVFNGALAVALAEGKPMLEAVSFACKAAALSVTRLGAQASAPYKNEIEAFAKA